MDDVPDQGNLNEENVGQRDDAIADDSHDVEIPDGNNSSAGPSGPPIDWQGFKIPKKRPGETVKGSSKKRKSHSKNAPDPDRADDIFAARAPPSSSSSSSEDSDKESDDSSDSQVSSDIDNEAFVDPRAPPVTVKRPTATTTATPAYTRFDPGAGEHEVFVLPFPDMVDYASKRFLTFVPDKKIKDMILNDYPVPSGVPGVEVPQVDDYIIDIFNAKKQDYGKYTDDTWVKMHNKVVDVMGPLSKLWSTLETIRVADDDSEIDLFECLDLAEKTITLLGQASLSFNYFRRQGFLTRLTRDSRKAKQLLKHHDVTQMQSHNKLFGKAFYKRLTKSAKVHKQSKEISSQLSGQANKKAKFSDGRQNAKGNDQPEQQPFRGGPSSRGGRGGGRKVSVNKRGKPSGNRGKCLIKVCFNKKSKSKKIDKLTRSDRRTISVVKNTTNVSRVKKCLSHRIDIGRHCGTRQFTPCSEKLAFCPSELARQNRGRLQWCLANWQVLTTDPFVLGVVKGLQIPFVKNPVQQGTVFQYPLSPKESTLVEEEITSMLGKGAILEVTPVNCQFVSPLFLVPKKDGGQRPVINLKALNSCVLYQHFKMEGLHLLKDLIQPGDYMVKLDLKDAYFSVPVDPKHAPFLRFAWKDKLYQFQCMPFGLGPAPRVFTKIMKPIVALLRRLGLRIIIYLDDMILLNQTESGLLRDRDSLLYLLMLLGFAINWKKSFLVPTQTLEFLGFTINTVSMMMSLPEGKITKIVQKCQRLISDKVVSVRNIAEIVGQLTASVRAILPAPLHYRHMQMTQTKALLTGKSYEAKVTLTPDTLLELRWWISNIKDWNGRAIITPSPDLTIETDASLSGWGAAMQNHRIGGAWSPEEASLHINVLELRGALFAVRAFAMERTGIHVHLRMDNVSAVTYIQKMGGTRSQQLLKEARELWDFCLEKSILLSAEYLPGHLNVRADWESRNLSDSSDWRLEESLFQAINTKWGPFLIDLFASRLNAQVNKYVSWRPDPFAIAVDAFLLEWNMEGAYLFPPFSMIPRCLSKVYKDRATVVIVTPTWHSQPWYPTLLEMVVDTPVLLPKTPRLLLSPRGDTHPLAQQGSLQLAVWKISGRKPCEEEFLLRLPTCWQNTHGVRALEALTRAPGDSGVAGVSRGKLIPFAPLWSL